LVLRFLSKSNMSNVRTSKIQNVDIKVAKIF
jgi:hypothetical protein